MYEITKRFTFEAAHTLKREISSVSSKRIHGHSYRAEITVRGVVDPMAGMVIDIGLLEHAIAKLHDQLDHHFLNEVPALGIPTMENLCAFIWRDLQPQFPGLHKIAIHRDTCGNSCVYYGN
jgi:6-pyruvoyltetrahydropterin/6-carboxytetrahydropterin synthase